MKISRATTLGDNDGLNSAFYLEGKEAVEDRMRNIGQKQNGRDYHDTFMERAKWVQYLNENTYKNLLSENQQKELQNIGHDLQIHNSRHPENSNPATIGIIRQH